MITDATDAPDGSTPKVVHHFPDWTVEHLPTRDSNNIPTKRLWGQAEAGSPRDLVAAQPGDLSCAGQGLLIEGTTGDNVPVHSAIWNSYDPTLMGIPIPIAAVCGTRRHAVHVRRHSHRPAHNNMSVSLVTRASGGPR